MGRSSSAPPLGPTHGVQIALDFRATSLHDVVRQVVPKIIEDWQLPPSAATEVTRILHRQADMGLDSLRHSVAVFHQRARNPCPNIQLLVRLNRSDATIEDDGEPIHFLWVLISNHDTHPFIDAAAEFAELMDHSDFRQAALKAEKSDDLEHAYQRALEREVMLGLVDVPDGGAFSGFKRDIQRKLPFYASDFTDGLSAKAAGSAIFLFFACMAPAVAFGGLTSVLTHGQIGVVEAILASAICGLTYALCAGQPLTIIGQVGPVVIFTGVLYAICERYQFPFLASYAWVGLWTALFLLIAVATNASRLIRYFTRFVDETFAALISLIFLHDALVEIARPFLKADIVYAQALATLLLAIGTFVIATQLSRFRRSLYLRRRYREFFADFGPTIAIGLGALAAFLLREVRPTSLSVPSHFAPSIERGWFINLTDVPLKVCLLAAIPGFLLAILLFLTQNITVRLINSPNNKLKKSEGYHLDLAVIAALIALCSVLGLPWFVAATVRSLNHVRSLATVRMAKTGEERVLSVLETRMTGVAVHVLIGLSLLVLPLLSFIPMAVLYGLFLFMGTGSLRGNQFFERLRLWLMDPRLQPPTYYLRAVPAREVHRYTAIQLAALVVLWIIQSSAVALFFPIFIAALVPVRMSLRKLFKREHLALLDAEETPEQEQFREMV